MGYARVLPIGGRPGVGAEREVGCTASAACWLEVGGWRLGDAGSMSG